MKNHLVPRGTADSNLFLLMLDGIPRSNNAVEGFHNALKSSVTNSNPNLWRLLGALVKEEHLSQTKMTHLRRGDQPKRKKRYQVISEKLATLVSNCACDRQTDKLAFLKSVSYNLHDF